MYVYYVYVYMYNLYNKTEKWRYRLNPKQKGFKYVSIFTYLARQYVSKNRDTSFSFSARARV